MKILTVVGARPQFIKAAAVSRTLRKEHTEVLVHTGQHYDRNMSEIFFEELELPRPDYNLGVGSGSHARQTADMMVGVEEVLEKEKPDAVLVYGDTNSALAGVLAASKLHYPVAHVEAGPRAYNMRIPEEQNRIVADHLSRILFAPTQASVENLAREGIVKNVYNVGDVIYDAVLHYSKRIGRYDRAYFLRRCRRLCGEGAMPEKWYLATLHRPDNTDAPAKLFELMSAFEEFPLPVIFPVHPRTAPLLRQVTEKQTFWNTVAIEPVGYLDMLFLTKNARKVVTDSGGLQKEAYFLNTPCVTLRSETEWVETLMGNHNVLCEMNRGDILRKTLRTEPEGMPDAKPYGDGTAAEKITQILSRSFAPQVGS